MEGSGGGGGGGGGGGDWGHTEINYHKMHRGKMGQ